MELPTASAELFPPLIDEVNLPELFPFPWSTTSNTFESFTTPTNQESQDAIIAPEITPSELVESSAIPDQSTLTSSDMPPDPLPINDTLSIRNQTKDILWLSIFAVFLLGVGIAFYVFLKGGLPQDNPALAVNDPSLPLKGSSITVDSLSLDWRTVSEKSDPGVRSGNVLVPQITLGLAPSSQGALRLFFRNEYGTQVGDTINLRILNGLIEGKGSKAAIICTDGLPTMIEYDNLRSRESSEWIVEIYEGTDPYAPVSSFSLIKKIQIPWKINASSLQ